eukprot:980359-Lingulodinium_polyedra.AAC.1
MPGGAAGNCATHLEGFNCKLARQNSSTQTSQTLGKSSGSNDSNRSPIQAHRRQFPRRVGAGNPKTYFPESYRE